jgi:hypothetical protein
VRHGFYRSSSSSIFILRVMSYGLELELERTVTNALSIYNGGVVCDFVGNEYILYR